MKESLENEAAQVLMEIEMSPKSGASAAEGPVGCPRRLVPRLPLTAALIVRQILRPSAIFEGKAWGVFALAFWKLDSLA